jgi:hypothetical protein
MCGTCRDAELTHIPARWGPLPALGEEVEERLNERLPRKGEAGRSS